jgi:hypothetical protein
MFAIILSLPDPASLNFALPCSTKALQGSWQQDADGNRTSYTNISIGNKDGQLQDLSANRTGIYAASFDGRNVSLTDSAGSTQNGAWLQGTGNVAGVPGGGNLGGRFTFHFYDHGKSQQFNFDWKYAGPPSEAATALRKANFVPWSWRLGRGNHYRLPAQPARARNAVHFIMDRMPPNPSTAVLQTTGQGHTGEYDPGLKHLFYDWLRLR